MEAERGCNFPPKVRPALHSNNCSFPDVIRVQTVVAGSIQFILFNLFNLSLYILIYYILIKTCVVHKNINAQSR